MCVAENDVLTVKDIAIEGYAAAREHLLDRAGVPA
jgi:hypothetical protein